MYKNKIKDDLIKISIMTGFNYKCRTNIKGILMFKSWDRYTETYPWITWDWWEKKDVIILIHVIFV